MKNSLTKIAVAVFTAGTLNCAIAQKIAHISLDSLVSMMPETKTAKEVATAYSKDLEKTVISMDNELQTKYNDYVTNGAGMSDLVKKTKEEELQMLQKRIEDFKMQANQDYQRKSAELTAPIMDKAKKAIESVAKEGGYKYVLDTSPGNVLYFEPGDDILLVVKKKLDSMPAANIPGANPSPKNNTPVKNTGGGAPKK